MCLQDQTILDSTFSGCRSWWGSFIFISPVTQLGRAGKKTVYMKWWGCVYSWVSVKIHFHSVQLYLSLQLCAAARHPDQQIYTQQIERKRNTVNITFWPMLAKYYLNFLLKSQWRKVQLRQTIQCQLQAFAVASHWCYETSLQARPAEPFGFVSAKLNRNSPPDENLPCCFCCHCPCKPVLQSLTFPSDISCRHVGLLTPAWLK